MERVLNEICGYIHNYFVVKPNGVHRDTFNISDGVLDVDFLKYGQYFRIKDSIFNDGVYTYPASDLKDEEFVGEVWAMAVPPDVIELATEIANWETKYNSIDSPNMSPFTSESFNNYSYSKGSRNSGGGTSSVTPTTWQDVFGYRLRRYKRLHDVI